MSAGIWQRSHKNCGRKILVPCLFHPYLHPQLEIIQGGTTLGISDPQNVNQLCSVLALLSPEGCVSTCVLHFATPSLLFAECRWDIEILPLVLCREAPLSCCCF
uniref:Uncharacterized protein n=1 Tax=Amazona collaria TaxID=241587 RepID=A0A8B9FFX2_9PSIT